MNFFKNPYQIFLILSLFMASLCLISFVYFNLGLFYDGPNFLYYILQDETFNFFEVSRKTFHFFQQFPVWLFLHATDSSSLPVAINLYSFGMIWIHIPALFICYFILPARGKLPFIFPLFAFFTGPLTAFNFSISAGLSLVSYLWAVAFIIYYSDLSLKSHRALMILSILPLFRSHELMSYMSLFFILLCFLKYKKEKVEINRYLILACICFFIFIFVYHAFDLFYLDGNSGRRNGRSHFLSSFFNFEFLFIGSLLNLLVLISLLLKICFLIELFINKYKIYYFLGLILLLLFLKISFFSHFILDSNFVFYTSRFYSPVISLPFCLLLWIIYEKKTKSWKPSKPFLALCFLTFIGLTFYRIQWDSKFYKSVKNMTNHLSKCKGVLSHSSYKWMYKGYENYIDSPKILAQSILYPKKKDIHVIIKNDLNCNIIFEKMGLNRKQVKNLCNSLNLGFPKILLEPDFKLEQRFFNFTPLHSAYKQGISSCSN